MDKKTGLILRLQDEADLCRSDGAGDIAALLDEAVEAIRDRNHDTQVGEKWREDSRLETWFPLTAERLAEKERELSIAHMALTAIRSHWREFGPECGFDETLEEACKVLGA